MDIAKEYRDITADYEDFLSEFKRVLEKILSRNEIPTAFAIHGRYKTLNSIVEKIDSKRFRVKQSIKELNDLVGLRIVLLFPEYKDKVVEILSSEFKVLNNLSKSNQNLDRFGYSSIHLILGIKDEWAKTPDWQNHTDKRVEVQIRTLSEHIWAETSHTLFYKREENTPNELNRDLYRLSALLEIVDDKLQSLKSKVEEYKQDILQAPYSKILKLDLNSETFRRVMSENSKGVYNMNDYKNKALSSIIEKDYNILNVNIFHDLIANKIDLNELNTDGYVEKVIEILEEYKKSFNQ